MITNNYFQFQQTSNLLIFSNETKVRDFIGKFLPSEKDAKEQIPEQMTIVQLLSLQFYHCLIKDTMHALRIHIDLLMVNIALHFVIIVLVEMI